MPKAVDNEQELGYPHELISLSLKKSNEVLDGRYGIEAKVIALLLRSILNEKHKGKIKLSERNNPNLQILFSLAKKSKTTVTKYVKDYRDRLKKLIEEYLSNRSTTAFAQIRNFIKDGVFSHIIAKKITGISVFSSDEIDNVLSIFDAETEIALRYIILFLRVLDDKSARFETNINEIMRVLYSVEDSPLIESVAFLSYVFAMGNVTNKRDFLLLHYQLVKKIVQSLAQVVEHKRLDDIVLIKLFRSSIILFLCGYGSSLRLSHEEKMNYVERILSIPTIVYNFERAFDKYATISYRGVKIPLLILVLIDFVFLLIHFVREVNVPITIGISIVNFSLPFNVPIFLTISLILTAIVGLRLFILKSKISEELRKGEQI